MKPIRVGDLVYLFCDDIICDEQIVPGIVVAWHPELCRYKVLIEERLHLLPIEYLRKIK